MKNHIRLFVRFFRFYARAKTKYRVHSPFVFEFVNTILEDNQHYYAYENIEILRNKFSHSQETITLRDYGAGSNASSKKTRTIASIAKTALSFPFECRILFKIAQTYKPKNILELGTSLGISTLYLAEGNINAQTITLEGDPEIACIARSNFDYFYVRFKKEFYPNKIRLIEGPFEDTLAKALKNLQKLDMVFIDGNHRKEPTLRYFKQCLSHAHADSIFIFDDINWSEEMQEAWEAVKQDPAVTLSIDLFYMGIVFFKKDFKEKEHFSLLPAKYKPFSWGLFH